MTISFNISKTDFLTALTSLQNVTGKKGTIAILANVFIKTINNGIEITGTDLEVGIRHIVPAEIISSGSITLPSKKLFEIARESGADEISIEEHDNSWVKIKAGSSVYNLAGSSSEEFPEFPEYDEENLVKIPADVIKKLINKTIFSIAQERESHYSLTGILFEKEEKENNKSEIRMISSDGHRLSIMKKPVDIDTAKMQIEKNKLIPKKGVSEIKRFCEGIENVYIGFEKKQAVIKADNSLMIVRLMNGDFPDYKSILDIIDKNKYIELEKTDFLEAIKRTSLFSENTFNAVQLDIKADKMILSSQTMDFGNATDEINISYKGDDIILGFNCRYFIDTLQAMQGDIIKLFISSDQSPCLITSEDDPGFFSIIMPMKI